MSVITGIRSKPPRHPNPLFPAANNRWVSQTAPDYSQLWSQIKRESYLNALLPDNIKQMDGEQAVQSAYKHLHQFFLCLNGTPTFQEPISEAAIGRLARGIITSTPKTPQEVSSRKQNYKETEKECVLENKMVCVILLATFGCFFGLILYPLFSYYIEHSSAKRITEYETTLDTAYSAMHSTRRVEKIRLVE